MKDFFSEHKEFVSAVAAITVGATIGFVCARFINEKLSNHAFHNCPSEDLVFLQDSFVGGKYICLKK
jgi:hypothetical protein